MLVRIPYDRTAERVARLLAMKMEKLPEFIPNSVTWDQGKEMARHKDFAIATERNVNTTDHCRSPSRRRCRSSPVDVCACCPRWQGPSRKARSLVTPMFRLGWIFGDRLTWWLGG